MDIMITKISKTNYYIWMQPLHNLEYNLIYWSETRSHKKTSSIVNIATPCLKQQYYSLLEA